MKEHPLPPSPTRNLLAWQPIFARVSIAGDLGYTTGPWEYKDNIKDEKPSGYGNFVTVWKKQADGSWKFVVDLGISHPMSAGPLKLWQVSDTDASSSGHGKKTINVQGERTALLERGGDFQQPYKARLKQCLWIIAADELRLFRSGSLPFVGKQPANSAFANHRSS
jgi:hypothetical protein